MPTLKIAMVEDDAAERARIRECLSYVEETEKVAFLVTEFSTGASFLGNYTREFDIVLMDIKLPGMNGMDTARELRMIDGDVVLIFITKLAQFAIPGYEVDALDYVLKPINKYSFALKMKRAVARTSRRGSELIPVRCDGSSHMVRISAIQYLEVTGHYVNYHTLEGEFQEYATLKDVYGRINSGLFVFASRNYLVNLQHVTAVNRGTVTVGGQGLQISRPQRRTFLTAVADYMRGKL